ncbi:kinase-like domain-containing protein [Rhizophagus irregularis DAOM 181602=DAOM 197198]|nr:kinase-like domain-containing protein [Rhizophagus irregularis DAOM 181602=DAOM 197198]
MNNCPLAVTSYEEVVHRDIRWDNVVKLTDGKWLLIDFEEAARIGDERNTLKIAAPEYENGIDICQASGLIEDSNQRPTAIDALNDDWFKEMDNLME